ncbi:hypothetical protein HOY80DRAFT_1133977, partial [Tuber brumale]
MVGNTASKSCLLPIYHRDHRMAQPVTLLYELLRDSWPISTCAGDEIARLERQLQQEGPKWKKEKKELEAKYIKKRDEEAERRAHNKVLKATATAQYAHAIELSQELEKAMKGTCVPIVAAVVIKAMYKKAVNIGQDCQKADGHDGQNAGGEEGQNTGGQDDRAGKILKHSSKFLKSGYEDGREVTEFAKEIRKSRPHHDDVADDNHNKPGFEARSDGGGESGYRAGSNTGKSRKIQYFSHIMNRDKSRHRAKIGFAILLESLCPQIASLLSIVIPQRNTAAHEVPGDDVLAILPHCRENQGRVLEWTFRSLRGISPSDWRNATLEEKQQVFRNSTNCEPDRLGYQPPTRPR